jgi:hypothetical protein
MTPRRPRRANPARSLAALGLALALAAPGFGGGSLPLGPPGDDRAGLPTKAEAGLIIARLRAARESGTGPSYVEFRLGEYPRRGPETVALGRLWTGASEGGPAMRITVFGPGGPIRILVLGGPHPLAWRWSAGSPVQACDILAPLLPGSNLTPFDLELPFLSWPEPRVLSVNHILGRPTNGFVFQPPAEFLAAHPDLLAVRAYLDRVYQAPLRIQLIGPDQAVRKTISLVLLKRVADQWMPAALDFRDELTHHKTRLTLAAAAFTPPLAPRWFQPDHLADPDRPPAGIVRMEP